MRSRKRRSASPSAGPPRPPGRRCRRRRRWRRRPLAAAAAALLRRRGCAPELGGLAVPAAFAGAYAAALAALLPLSGANPPPRYLAPLYPPLLAGAAIVLGGLLRCLARRGPFVRWPLARGAPAASVPALALAAALALWLAPQAAANHAAVRERGAGGDDGLTRTWRGSATLRWMNDQRPGGRIWNNAQQWVYILADARAEHRPLQPRLLEGSLGESVRRLLAEARADGAAPYVAWFHAGGPWAGYGVADLAALPELEVAAILEDGVVFRPAADRGAPRAPLADRLLGGARLLARSHFDVHLDEARNRLVYVREACGGVGGTHFFLHVWPEDGGRPANLDFRYDRHGFREGMRCLAVRDLPDYAVAGVGTGQWIPGDRELWSVRVPVRGSPAAAAIDLGALRARAERLGAGAFEVYRDGARLVYVREGCDVADVAAPFFLHVVPRDREDLPGDRRESGFSNLDFAFDEAGAIGDGRCAAVRELPAYPIAAVRTGQWIRGGGELWRVEAALPGPP